MAIRVQCADCQTKFALRDSAAGRRIRCQKCGHAISVPEAASEQRSPTRETSSTLTCPACQDSPLKQRELKNGILIDDCPSCRGTWLDGGELLELTQSKEAARQGTVAIFWDATETDRICPRCDSPMREGEFLDSDTLVDCCDNCNGLWFDAGELKQTLREIAETHEDDESDLNVPTTAPSVGSKQKRTRSRRTCPECTSRMSRKAVICVDCGYDTRTGELTEKHSSVKSWVSWTTEPKQESLCPVCDGPMEPGWMLCEWCAAGPDGKPRKDLTSRIIMWDIERTPTHLRAIRSPSILSVVLVLAMSVLILSPFLRLDSFAIGILPCLMIVYVVAAMSLNRLTIQVADGRFVVQHAPIPWFGNLNLRVDDVEEVFGEVRSTSDENGTSYYGQVFMVVNGARRKLVKMPSVQEAHKLAFLITKALEEL